MSRLRICPRCRGAGSLLRPQKGKTLTFKRCTDCGGKGLKGVLIVRLATMEELVARLRREGKEFGRKVREEQGLPQMPEPVREGNTCVSEEAKTRGVEVFRISTMHHLGLVNPDRTAWSWSQFFDRKQEEIHPWAR